MAISKAGSVNTQSITAIVSQMDAEIAALAEQIALKTGKPVDSESLVSTLGLEGAPGSFWKTGSEDEEGASTGGIVDDDWSAIAMRLSARTGQSFTAADLLARFGGEGMGAVAEVEKRSGRTAMRNDLEAQMKALRMRSR